MADRHILKSEDERQERKLRKRDEINLQVNLYHSNRKNGNIYKKIGLWLSDSLHKKLLNI